MKKILILLLSYILIFSLTACSEEVNKLIQDGVQVIGDKISEEIKDIDIGVVAENVIDIVGDIESSDDLSTIANKIINKIETEGNLEISTELTSLVGTVIESYEDGTLLNGDFTSQLGPMLTDFVGEYIPEIGEIANEEEISSAFNEFLGGYIGQLPHA